MLRRRKDLSPNCIMAARPRASRVNLTSCPPRGDEDVTLKTPREISLSGEYSNPNSAKSCPSFSRTITRSSPVPYSPINPRQRAAAGAGLDEELLDWSVAGKLDGC